MPGGRAAGRQLAEPWAARDPDPVIVRSGPSQPPRLGHIPGPGTDPCVSLPPAVGLACSPQQELGLRVTWAAITHAWPVPA